VATYVASATQGALPVTAYAAARWRSSVPRTHHPPPRELNEKA
jgi:hypothetical protein